LVLAPHAFVLGQLSVVCIWSVIAMKKSAWLRASPVLAVILAALAGAILSDSRGRPVDTLVDNLSFFGSYAAILIVALWLLRRTPYWRRTTGDELAWQYSLGQLLIAMTIVSVLAAALQRSSLLGEDRAINIAFTSYCVALAIASVFIWSQSWHSVLRLAATLATAILLNLALLPFAEIEGMGGVFFLTFTGAHFLIQGLVLSLWLGIGGLLPLKETAGVEE
jgi:hypothetical protein